MAQCIYITVPSLGAESPLWCSPDGMALEPGAYRGVLQAGRHVRKPTDRLIHVILARYGSRFPYVAMYGCTHEQALDLVGGEHQDALFQLILISTRPGAAMRSDSLCGN